MRKAIFRRGGRPVSPRKIGRTTLLAAVVAVAAVVLFVPGTSASIGSGGLNCPLPVGNNTHYDLTVGDEVTCTIEGAGVPDGQIDVWIKSSHLGNTLLDDATATDGDITFTFTAPEGGCFTTIVAYGSVGTNANNSFIHPEGPLGPAGFRYVDSPGHVVDECGTTNASPEIVTVPSEGGATGGTLNDTATLSNGQDPGGSITFELFAPGDDNCEGPAVYTQIVPVSGNGDYNTTPGYVTLVKGTYNWLASYSGDGGNEPVSSFCNEEALDVEAAAPTVLTAVHDPAHNGITNTSVNLGTSIHDNASVSGPAALGTPTGTIDFAFFKNAGCEGDPDVLISQVGVALVNGVAESTATGPLGAGSYSYLDHYNSDNLDVWQGSDGDCEPVTIKQGDTTTVTHVHNASHVDITGKTVPVGSFVHDNASVGGAVTGVAMGGTVTFHFFKNGICDGTPFSDQGPLALGTESTAQQITAPGNYSYLADYSGDTNYKASSGACEPFGVFNPPLTPGYWKTHQTQTTALLTSNCIKIGNYPAGCLSWSLAYNIFNAMNCSNTSGQNSIGCLAGHLLATKLNLANLSNPCISGAVTKADSWLKGTAQDGVAGINYNGPPPVTYSLTNAQRAEGVALKNPLDKYNNGGGC